MKPDEKTRMLRRIRLLTALFITGLVLSGMTAIPLHWELDTVSRLFVLHRTPGASDLAASERWIEKVRVGLTDTHEKYPFLFYGTDWLAFGHMVIAIAFVGAWREPVRNRWLFDFGLIACVLVIPWALIFGAVRGIPWWWRLVDCAFGVVGSVPLWWCRRGVKQLAILDKRV